MKKNTAYMLLAVYGAICAILACMGAAQVLVGGILAFPFDILGRGLRSLSLSGSAGNICAIIIYAAFCLLPLVPAGLKLKKGGFRSWDWLLPVLSLAMFAVTYAMINPGLLGQWSAASGTVKAVLGGVCWSVILAWLVLGLLGRLEEREGQVLRWLRVLLWAMAVYFVTVAFGSGVSQLADSVRGVREGNSGRLDQLGLSYFVLALQFAVGALSHVLSAVTALKGAQLLAAMERDRYSRETVDMAQALGGFCIRCVKITVLSSLAFNLVQLVLLNALAAVNISVNIPLLSVGFVLAVMMLARFLRENKELKDDNDMFI